jgi:hypothetical protein
VYNSKMYGETIGEHSMDNTQYWSTSTLYCKNSCSISTTGIPLHLWHSHETTNFTMMIHCRRSFINVQAKLASRAFSSQDLSSLFNPTDEHRALRSMLRSFVKKEVCQPELFWIIPSRVFLVVRRRTWESRLTPPFGRDLKVAISCL